MVVPSALAGFEAKDAFEGVATVGNAVVRCKATEASTNGLFFFEEI
jgi:hypothetical protein